MIINIQIGDWSGDGHGRYTNNFYESNLPIEEVREAYFAARERLESISPEHICPDYKHATLSEQIECEAAKLGFNFDRKTFNSSQLADYTAWFCQQGHPTLKLTRVKPPPTLAFYGFDKKCRHVECIGYGLLP